MELRPCLSALWSRRMADNLEDKFTSLGRIVPVGLVAACAVSTSCMAQVAGLPTFGMSAPQITGGVDEFHFGPDLDVSYDSNVARSSAAVAKERGITPQDFYVVPSGDVSFSHVFGRETVFLEAQAGYQAYARNSILDRENISIQGGGIGQIGICGTTVSGAYTRAQANLDYLIIESDGKPAPTIKDARQNAIIDLTATCGRSIGFAPTFNVSETWLTNSSPLYALLDAHIFSGSGGIAYRNPVLGQISITGQYSNIQYPNRLIPEVVPTGIQDDTYGIQTVGGGVTYLRQIGRLTGTVSLSYEKLEPSVPVALGFSGLTYDVNLTYALTPRMNITALVGKATTPSNELQSSFSITQLYGLQATYAFGPRMSAQFGFSRTHQQYGGFVLPVTDYVTEQTTDDVFASVTRKLNRWLRVQSSLTYARRDANFAGLSYSDVLLSISASAAF